MTNFYVDAIKTIHPNVQFTAKISAGDEITAWDVDNNEIELDDAKIQVELARLQAEYDAQEYARNRKTEYDALNQFELISDDAINGTTTHKDAIVAVKTKYPKG
jgi:predicted phosphoribosyltransferase